MATKAIAYLRTSSATNVGPDKDSDKRQRAAIDAYAKAAGYEIIAEYYDAGVSGADPVSERPGFLEMLHRMAAGAVSTVIVESPDRFARDLLVQLTGFDYLKKLGISLIPASCPDFFTTDTPTATLIRSVLGAVAEFEKTSLVAKLAAARERVRASGKRCEGGKPLWEKRPLDVALMQHLRADGYSCRAIAEELAEIGVLTSVGTPYRFQQVARTLAEAPDLTANASSVAILAERRLAQAPRALHEPCQTPCQEASVNTSN